VINNPILNLIKLLLPENILPKNSGKLLCLKYGYVCEEDSKSKFKQMDPDRIKMLKEALFIKYKVKSQEQAKILKSMKSVAGRFCIDTRNKSKPKNNKQDQASTSLLSDE